MTIPNHHRLVPPNTFEKGVKYIPLTNAMTDSMIPMFVGRQNMQDSNSSNVFDFDINSLNLEIILKGPSKYTKALDIPYTAMVKINRFIISFLLLTPQYPLHRQSSLPVQKPNSLLRFRFPWLYQHYC